MRVFSQCSSQLQATIKAFFNNPAPATRSARSGGWWRSYLKNCFSGNIFCDSNQRYLRYLGIA